MVERKNSLRTAAFILIFGIAALVAMQINFSQIVGSQAKYFTVFQLFGPTAGAFLGAGPGAVIVMAAQVANIAIFGGSFQLFDILRLLTIPAAAVYFATIGKNKASAAIGIIAMALFMLHPVGAQAWVYSLFWLIPLIASFFGSNLVARSLGATFTAHAIGSIIWLYTIPSTPEYWLALIPVVVFERAVFAAGIAGSYVVLNSALYRVEVARKALAIEPEYALLKN